MASKKQVSKAAAATDDSINYIIMCFMRDLFRDDLKEIENELDGPGTTLEALDRMTDFCERWRYVFARAMNVLEESRTETAPLGRP